MAKVLKIFADKAPGGQSTQLFTGQTEILIAEDDSDLRLTLCEYLEARRFRVNSPRVGAEAIRMLESDQEFDIIFTDLMMPPGPNGLEVLKVARNLQPHAPAVVMTGYSSI